MKIVFFHGWTQSLLNVHTKSSQLGDCWPLDVDIELHSVADVQSSPTLSHGAE